MTKTVSGDEMEAWQKYLIGKQCPRHPDKIVKDGYWGLWCGAKTELGTWCDCGWPTNEWLLNFRKENNEHN